MDKINTIVFLFSIPVTQVEIERCDCAYLYEQGFDIVLLDLSYLLYETQSNKYTNHQYIVQQVDSFAMFEQLISNYCRNSIFIDFIASIGDIIWRTEKCFRILKKYDVCYFIVEAGALPIPSSDGDIHSKINLFVGKFKKIINPMFLIPALFRRATRYLAAHNILYPKPQKVFCIPSPLLENYTDNRNISEEDVIPISSYDYDVYLKYLNAQASEFISNNTCVFLDQCLFNHPDSILLSDILLPQEPYLKSLNRLFSKVEKETGLSVVIAAHPRSQYDKIPDAFNGRVIIKGNTIDLVAKSSLVLTHFTTAVNYAVLFNKPLLLVRTADMHTKPYNEFIDLLAEALGVRALDIDDEYAFNTVSFDHPTLPKRNYDEYKYKYTQAHAAGSKRIWGIVVDQIRKYENE